ncbi:hypothetical protein Bbelb_065010 [Branchiostoma belcheri]|nr:hypothetical protein Bbelb_065010 [Branchiostoma belcheri]
MRCRLARKNDWISGDAYTRMAGRCSLAMVMMTILVGLLRDQPGVLSAPAEPDPDGNLRNAQLELQTNLNRIRKTMAAFKGMLASLEKRIPTIDSRVLALERQEKEIRGNTEIILVRVENLENTTVSEAQKHEDLRANSNFTATSISAELMAEIISAVESRLEESEEQANGEEESDGTIDDSTVVHHSLTLRTSSVPGSGSRDYMTVEIFSDVCDNVCTTTTISGLTEHGWIGVDNVYTGQHYRFPCTSPVCEFSADPTEGSQQVTLELHATHSTSSSCTEVTERSDFNNHGFYTIDPDGPGRGGVPMVVQCDLEGQTAITLIGHNREARTHVNGYENPGVYSKDVTYWNNMEQVRALVNQSSLCKQLIKYECHNSLMWTAAGPPSAWWVTWDGRQADYWGGASPGSGKCACGQTGSCRRCYCDINDNRWRADSGYLTHKNDLPVTQLRFGDTGSGHEQGYHTLGKLICYP